MRLRECFGTLVAVCLLIGAASTAMAQPPTAGGYPELQRAIAEQEARLRHLETRRLPAVNDASDFYSVSTNSALENRMAELEQYVHELRQEKDQGKENDTKPTHKWSGRVHYDYWSFPNDSPLINYLDSDPNNAAIPPADFHGFRRLRFGVSGDIGATMNYKIEMDFADPSNLAFKDAYLGWKELPILHTVLLGNQKRPYGLDHLNSSRYNVFMERPFHVEAFNQDARRVGVQSYGLSENQAWNWRYGYFLMDDLAKVGGQYTDNYQSEFAGRLANTIWYDESSGGRGYAHWAVSGSAAFPGGGPDARFTTRPEARTAEKWFDTSQIAGGKRYQLLGLEGVINVGAFQVVGEYQSSRVERTQGFGPDLDFSGYYVQAAYFLTGEHTPWERKSGTIGRVKPFENFFLVDRCLGGKGWGAGAWQIAARYSHSDFTDDDIFGGVGDSMTFGLNWWWTPYSRMQFNYIYGSIAQRAAVGGAPLVPGSTSDDYDIFGTRFMVDF